MSDYEEEKPSKEFELVQWTQHLDDYLPTPGGQSFFHTLKLPGNGDVLKFEWDKRKDMINIQKHSISFRFAMLVFADEDRLELIDERHSSSEKREKVIGCIEVDEDYHVIVVIYTKRFYQGSGFTYRLISARQATEREVELYYDQD